MIDQTSIKERVKLLTARDRRKLYADLIDFMRKLRALQREIDRTNQEDR